MAPDINSMPSSPRQDRPQPSLSTSTLPSPGRSSRRTSQIMGPPSAPTSAVPHSTQHTVHHITQPHRNSMSATVESLGVPLRHPRPLTAAELYLECEKEQEAVVNRLTRELTALRAQSASVASNASLSSTSTSASILPIDITDPNPTHQMTGATHPTPSRRDRSSSSVSSRSITTPHTASSMTSSTAGLQTVFPPSTTSTLPLGTISQASADRAAAATGTTLSRQPSISASEASTPARRSLDIGRATAIPHRPSLSRDPSVASSTVAHVGTPHPPTYQSVSHQSPTAIPVTLHHADTLASRSEMEVVKAENEALRQRVRALERALHRATRRESIQSERAEEATPFRSISSSTSSLASASVAPPVTGTSSVATWAAGDGGIGGVAGPRERSESQSTTASSRRAYAGAVLGAGGGPAFAAPSQPVSPNTTTACPAGLGATSPDMDKAVSPRGTGRSLDDEVEVGESAASSMGGAAAT